MNIQLVAIDPQNDFASEHGALSPISPEDLVLCEAVIDNMVDKINYMHRRGLSVIYTRDTHKKDAVALKESREARKLSIPHTVCGEWGWQFHPKIDQIIFPSLDCIIEKETFGSLELAQELIRRNESSPIDAVCFMGFDTDICVISNVIIAASALPSADIVLLKDCCWGTTKENHKRTLKTMKQLHVTIC